jgi:hypothetical protein
MGCDVCYTNHAAADQNTTDNLLLLLTLSSEAPDPYECGSLDMRLIEDSGFLHDPKGLLIKGCSSEV